MLPSACGSQTLRPEEPSEAAVVSAPADLARGGRLFDAWAVALSVDFVADDPSTASADGRGGPFGNGTLPDAAGQPMLNTGHDYRFVKLFGDDLRGSESAFARCGTRASSVLVPALLSNDEDAAHWRKRLHDGEDGIPAFGSVLGARDIDDLLAFMLAVRDGALPSPASLFRTDAADPCGFRLTGGADAQAGGALHMQHCASCHGDDGKAMPIGAQQLSLGEFVRSRAPEAWYVMLSGKVGTRMPGLISVLPRDELESGLKQLMTAYMDDAAFPAH